MRFAVVRSAEPGCAKPCAEWISAEGRIVPETLARFRDVLRATGERRLPIFINSPGGSVEAALAIGRLVRARHLDVVVSRTLPLPCPDKPVPCSAKDETGLPLGLPAAHGAFCASACPLILAAGEGRFVPPEALVGVHEMIERRTLTRVIRTFRVLRRLVGGVPREVSRTLVATRPISQTTVEGNASANLYANVARYLDEMGLRPGLMPFMTSTPPTSMHWLTQSEIDATRLATAALTGSDLAERDEARDAAVRRAAALLPPTLKGGQRDAALRKLAAEAAGSERAFLVLQPGGGQAQRVIPGRATWSVAASAPDDGVGRGPQLEADVDIAEARLKMTVRLRRAASAVVPEASYVAAVRFEPAAGGVLPDIKEAGAPDFRSLPFVRGATLAPTALPVTANEFRTLVPASAADAERARFQIGSPGWMGVPFTPASGGSGTIVVEKGGSGSAAIRAALALWTAQANKASP